MQCPSDSCGSLFIAYYAPISAGNSGILSLERLAPTTFRGEDVPPTVAETSPSFVEIWNQALRAESVGLDQLYGIGLRKALEFLVKDFCKRQHPTEVPQIESLMLGPCIAKYVADANVKLCAERAAWLGNDETHYVRRWADKDVRDLKRLVQLTVNWIDTTIVTEQYMSDMPEGRR